LNRLLQRAANPLPKGEGTAASSRDPRGGLFVVEACEYRANFLHLRPWQAAVLGIEPDHFDYYDSLVQLEGAFRRFAESIPKDGFLLARHDCQSTRRVAERLGCRVESFGLSAGADWSGHGLEEDRGRFRFEIRRFGQRLCEVKLLTPGEHNVLNALAAAALAYENDVPADQISAGLGGFRGLHRRLEQRGQWRGATWIDDYAHHPTEVTAALATVRAMFPAARVWCVFQPHQASRTARLLDELAASLQNADKVMVAEIFRAREGNPQPGEVTAADLARRAGERGAEVLPARAAIEIIETLETQLAPGDVLVTLGAGDVWKIGARGEGRGKSEDNKRDEDS
jgi:UDP-N-acetylmuramate--alanine ligase